MSSLSVTAWRLSDPAGILASCTITQREAGWELAIRHGRGLVISEHCPSDDAAFERSTEIWTVLREQGWTDQQD